MNRYIIFLLILLCFSCQRVQHSNVDTSTTETIPKISNSRTASDASGKVDDVESFTEESKIGRPGKNKVEISCFRNPEKELVKITFYSNKGNGDWQLKQSLEFEKTGGGSCDPQFEDFNNDGLNDLTFISGEVARGANEIRTLLIYDKKSDELLHIKNSADYPNLAYNSRLDCIDAWLFYGGTATVFLKLKGDMLEEFASVEDFPPNRTVTVGDRNGRNKVIRRDKIDEVPSFTRYKNFKPLEY